jgi:rhodanese-related sulfurtransferase
VERVNWRLIRSFVLPITILFSLLAPSCTTADQDQEKRVNSITVSELYQMCEDREELFLLDVRSVEEYQAGHLAGATLIPIDRLEEAAEGRVPSDGTRIIVYCRTQNRSSFGIEVLQGLGYKNVILLSGGFQDWSIAGYSFYNMHGELTMKSYGKSEGE